MPGLTATQSAEGKLTGLARLHVKAKQDRSLRFSNLLHHITPEMMEKAYKSLNRQSARGVDQQSWEQYGKALSARLLDLHQRIHTGQYKPQPVLRLWLPKPNGEKRPIGITAVEDKVVQQATVWVLEAIYEVDFLGFSYGFRPKRNQHMALDAVYVAISQRKVSWILDADISQFFDTIDHSWLMRFLQHRIADKRLLHLIERTIKAGVIDEGRYAKTAVGTPQGDIAIIGEHLPSLCFGFMGKPMAKEKRQRGVLYRPLCG